MHDAQPARHADASTKVKSQFNLILIGILVSLLVPPFGARSQSVKPIFHFSPSVYYFDSAASLTLGFDGNLYGTTDYGGSNRLGSVFKVTANGTLTTVADFNGTNGACPYASVSLGADGSFYGTTAAGSSNWNGEVTGGGTVFRMATNGTLTTLVAFNGTNGDVVEGYSGSLTPGPDGNFYGATAAGGNGDNGTLFQMTTNGTLTTLVEFNGTNGTCPFAGLTLGLDGNFYGTTAYGGVCGGYGTVFEVTTNGTLTTLFNFNGTNGAAPLARLTWGPDGNLYGTTSRNGAFGWGTLFRVTTNGTVTTLVNFDGTNGAYSSSGLTLGPDGNLYGTTEEGGSNSNYYGYGTVFRVTTNGSLTRLVSFNQTNGNPAGLSVGYYCVCASLTLGPDGNFYGVTSQGPGQGGTIFQLELPPDFMTSPASQSADIGGSAAFNCQPFGTAPFTYEWLSNGVPIAGATGSSLIVSNVSWQMATTAQYQVVVTNAWGSITSSVAGINPAPAIMAQPADQTVPIGSPAVFAASVTGFAPLSSQWYFNSVLLAGATNPAMSISPALTNEIGTYQLVVTNDYGSVSSRLASLNVLLQPNSYAISNCGAGDYLVFLGSYPNSTNQLWATTNLAQPPAQWQLIATNITDSSGLSQFLDTNTTGSPAKFYRLSQP